ncbi:MAG TPA: ABC transporter ATP-binding protein [Tepidisphaeraceae bacterium]|jgi:iron(III) transport system ATP-binding protein
MTSVRLENVSKRFDQTMALAGVNLEIGEGELFFLLGPSGCGKSTLLRIIAGLMQPTDGRVLFNGRDVTASDTQHRNAVMVFQSYALWPHMTVNQNVAFGMNVRRVSGDDQKARVAEVLRLVQLEGYGQRKPNQLSGGQQQRVALARALAVKPDALLLDEPLSNLDAKLRTEMRTEIRRICKRTGLTTIYVTHDQKEALSVADRIAVMKDGRLAQVGTPAELYQRPKSRFVAEFIGQTNLFEGRVLEQERGLVRMQTALGMVMGFSDVALPEKVTVVVRPEQLRVIKAPLGYRVQEDDEDFVQGRNRFVAKSIDSTFLGESSEHVLAVNGLHVKAVSTPPMFDVPEEVMVEFDPEAVVVLRE